MLGFPRSALIGSSARKSPIQTKGNRICGNARTGKRWRDRSAPAPRARLDPDQCEPAAIRANGENVRRSSAVTKIAGITVENASEASSAILERVV